MKSKLNLGCGNTYEEGYLNVDINPDIRADMHFDFDKKLPFPDRTFEEVKLSHSLEHSKDFGNLLKEIDRVLIGRGFMRIFLPTGSDGGTFHPGHNYFFYFIPRFGRKYLPNIISRLLGRIYHSEMEIRVVKR